MKFLGWPKYNKFLDKNYVKLVYKFAFVSLILSIPPALALIPMMYIPLPNLSIHTNTIVANQVDILFVIDNSVSTQSFHDELDSRIASFFPNLTGLDYRIAVTTTSVYCNGLIYEWSTNYAGKRGPPNIEHPDNCAFDPPYTASTTTNSINFPGWNYQEWITDGLLMPVQGAGATPYWITSSTPSPQTALGSTILFTNEHGSWSEQPLKAVYRAVERSRIIDTNGYNVGNNGFFRDSASFVVILVSDATESGVLAENQANFLYSYVNNLWPNKRFYFHSIYNATKDTAGPCDRNNATGEVETCSLNQITTITNLTNGFFGDVNSNNYSPYLSSLGTQIKNATRIVTLDCIPSGPVTITGPTPPSHSVILNEVHFTAFLNPGSYTFTYSCP